MALKIVIFLAGLLVGGILVFVLQDIDLLSSKKNYFVKLKKDVRVFDAGNEVLVIPRGTDLKFISQYNDVGNFSLEMIITDLSLIEKKEKPDSMYFVEKE